MDLVRFRGRFRTVVAMWIVVGLGGGLFLILVAAGAMTASGPFAPHRTVSTEGRFSPGEEVAVRGTDGVDLRPGDFVVLAHPATVDPAAVTCEWKSRVYSSGEQRSGTVQPVAVEGMEPVVTDTGSGVEYRSIMTTARGSGWMEIDYLTCRGDAVETFAVAEDAGMSSAVRSSAGLVAVIFGSLFIGTGFLALKITRDWARQPPAPTLLPYGHPGPYGSSPGAYPHNGQR